MKTFLLLPLILCGLPFQNYAENKPLKGVFSNYLAPTAHAGPDQTIYLTQTSRVNLNGSGTGAGITYHWKDISTDYVSGAVIVSPTSASTAVTGLSQGTFYFELTVKDNTGAVAKDTVVIRVDYDVPPANSTILSQMIFSDMAPVINLRDDTTVYFGTSDKIHSRGGTIPNRYLFYRDRLQNMMIDSSRGKLYSIIRDGIPGGTGDFARSDMSIRNDLDNFPLDSNITYVMEWKGYFSPLPAYANTAAVLSIHGNNEVSGPFSLRMNGANFGMSENFTSGQDNGKNATPAIPDSYVFTDFFPMTDIINRSRTVRVTVREGAGFVGQDAFIKVEVDGVLYYSRYTGQVGQTLQQDYPKMATLYDAAKSMIDPNNRTRGRKVSLTTEKFTIYGLKDTKGSNIPPTANAGSNKTITLPVNTVSLSGSGSDTDGTISNYLWTKTSGPSTYKIVNAGSPVTDVTGLVEGVYQFELKVTDDKGATATSTVQVTVNAAANTPPTANAGSNKTITLPVNTVSLSGSGSDTDGTISNYLWTKTYGPSTYKIVNAGSPVTDVTGLVEGVYQFELKVTDDKGATATSTVQVTVNAAVNIPPTANAGSNQTITLPVNTVSLSGSGSDTDGTISNYLWTKASGPSTYKIVNAASPVTDVTGLVEGVYLFELKVTDDKGATATSTVQITVNAAANIPPTANAGSNKTITLPVNTVSLSGSGNDADGTISNYLWTKTAGPSTYNIINAGSPVTDVTGLIEGVYQFELKVTDNKGATATSTVQITVNAAANIAPTANAGSNKTITLPVNTVTLSGSGSDADGTISNHLWTKTSGPSAHKIVNAESPVTDVTGLVEGIYKFEFKVTDDKGATATSTMQVTVNAAAVANIPPTANAGPDRTITLPVNSTSLSGSGSDVDGTISNYLWTKISGPSKYKIASVSSPVTEIKGLEQGIYQFELKVTDDKGATATSTVQVNVNAKINVSPNANAGGNKKITLPTSTTSLEGSGSDTDGTITNYKWTKTSGPSKYNIVNAESPVTDVTDLEEGVYQFELEVVDNDGAFATSTVEVMVSPAANISPIANAGASKTITLPTNMTSLSGSGSDADGTISNYLWTKTSGPSAYNIVNAGSPVTDVTGLEEGVYQFELKVTDNQGGTATSTLQVTVNPAPLKNVAPIANAGTDATIILPVNFVNLSGNGMDADGTIAKYQWKQISGPSQANIADAAKAGTSVSNLEGGTYEFELSVTDNKGATGKDTMVLVVALGRMASPGSNSLKVYPNPVRDIATVGIKTIENNSNLNLTISDINGRVIYKKVFRSKQSVTTEKINMTNYAKGIYLITVTFNEVSKKTFKIIKL